MPEHTKHTSQRLLDRYTSEVLSFCMSETEEDSLRLLDAVVLDRHVTSCLQALTRRDIRTIVIFGLGSGDFVRALAGKLDNVPKSPADSTQPQDIQLIICERSPSRVRNLKELGTLDWLRTSLNTHLLCDTSPWAHVVLLASLGISAKNAEIRINPELSKKNIYTPTLKTIHGSTLSALPQGVTTRPTISFAAILSPKDSGLIDFYNTIPAWADEVILVFDGESPKDIPLPKEIPARIISRPLDGDFAAQRNAMLSACTCDWVFTLDADERLLMDDMALIPRLAAHGEASSTEAFCFPRQTLYPDEKSFLCGYGLWPDLQLRLYRRNSGLTYLRRIHEKLSGLKGNVGIALDLSILHLARLLKDDAKLRQKLDVFNAAGKGTIQHRLNIDYPAIPAALFSHAKAHAAMRILTLPHAPI